MKQIALFLLGGLLLLMAGCNSDKAVAGDLSVGYLR
jgi:hypothetical protein